MSARNKQDWTAITVMALAALLISMGIREITATIMPGALIGIGIYVLAAALYLGLVVPVRDAAQRIIDHHSKP